MKTKLITGVFLAGILTLACAQSNAPGQTPVKNVSAEDFKTILESDSVVLIDIRTPGEYAQGHIEGASLIDFYGSDFRNQMADLDTTKTLMIYCRSGNRSGKAASMLTHVGFREIVNLQQGIIDWQRSGYSLVRD